MTLIISKKVRTCNMCVHYTFMFLMLMAFQSRAQYREAEAERDPKFLQQSDSIYVAHKVKSRTTYRLNSYGEKKTKVLVLNFSELGQITSLEQERFLNGQVYTTYYTYDGDHKLTSMKDQAIKGPHHKKMAEFFDQEKEIKAIPDREVYTYDFTTFLGAMDLLRRHSPDGVVRRKTQFYGSGLRKTSYVYDVKGDLERTIKTQYRQIKDYVYVPVIFEESYGMTIESTRTEFDYVFNDKKQIVERIVLKGRYDEKNVVFNYNEAGLITSATGKWEYVFEYEYY